MNTQKRFASEARAKQVHLLAVMRFGWEAEKFKRQGAVMKTPVIFLLGATALLGGACAPYYAGPPGPPPPAPGVVVAVEDQPYYTRGPYYIERGHRWVWVGGHWGHRHGHRVWIRGHYVIRD